ncbi:MAG: hypothetical protein RL701_4372 [Pseudomonadota bacterium]|jgi:hypothetical protein
MMRERNPLEALEVRASPIHGRGVFTIRRVQRGAWLGNYEGVPASRNGRYVLWVEQEDGRPLGISGRNALRFLNHSQTPNACFYGEELFALRNIAAGSELTIDYGPEWST